jgi:hypothetical protein
MAQPFLSALPQTKEREDEQNHDDQADEVNQTIHGGLPKLPLPWQPENKITLGEESSGGPHGHTGKFGRILCVRDLSDLQGAVVTLDDDSQLSAHGVCDHQPRTCSLRAPNAADMLAINPAGFRRATILHNARVSNSAIG